MPRSASPEPNRASSSLSSHRYRDGDNHKMKERDHESSSKRYRSDYDHDRHESDRRQRHSSSRRKDDYDEEEEEEERRRRRRRRERDEKDRDYDRKHRETSREREERKRRRHKEKSLKRHRNTSEEEDDDKKAERRAKAAETLLYTTENDEIQKTGNETNGSQTFTWAKKAERERKMGMTPAEARKRDEERRREAEEEIARLNQKRAEREKEQAIREEEESRMARLAESAAMADWVAKEDDFYLEQSRKRAVIRVRENRAKPIDLLAINLKWINPPSVYDGQNFQAKPDPLHPAEQNLSMEDEDDQDGDLEIDLEEPYLLFDNLDLDETEELYQDIQMYLSLEKNDQNLDFWRSMIVVCDDTLANLRSSAGQNSNEVGIRTRIDPSVKSEMDNMLSNKSQTQLLELQEQVRDKLKSQEPIDVEYWEGLLKAIVVWRAKAKLRDLHEVILSNRLEHLRQRQRIEEERRTRLGLPSIEEERVAKAAEAARRKAEREAQKQYDDGSEDLFAKEAAKALEEDEEVLTSRDEDLAAISNTANVYSWEDKYRPRKPRYFNKVHTGFEWNKYNQTHYDHDNPPPKQVQGYKFNIFYPDLIDKSKPPTFRILKEKGNDETCLIIFEAGPPYETIAFRIVNKPWNMSHQRGFKAVFERGVLQLHFNFQRMFYRK